MYEFFEKTIAANVVIQADSALSDQTASLVEEVVRRLKHTSESLPHSSRMEVLEKFSQKMANSGHRPKFMKKTLVIGIMKYVKKLKASKLDQNEKGYKPLHQP